MESGPPGSSDTTRARRHVTNRTPPQVERAVISIRKRFAKRASAETRYGLVGATQIRAELTNLGYAPVPSVRTIERIVNEAGLSGTG